MIRKIVVSVIVLTLIAGCNKKDVQEIVDRSGRIVTVGSSVERIISTAPSNTEIIVDLGLADKLIAVDKHSANIDGLPANLPLLDFFYPDAEVILNLKPDLIIASGHNATGTGEDPLSLLREAGISVVYISMSKSIEDIYLDIAFIAGLLHAEQEGEKLITAMKTEIDKIKNETAQHLNQPKVYFEISAAPDMMTFGNPSYINDMISVIGAQNIFVDDGWLVTPGAEAVIQRNPDIIFTTVNYIDDPIGEIKSRPGFNHIDAVKNDHVYYIDNDSASRSSARVILALQQMAEKILTQSTQRNAKE